VNANVEPKSSELEWGCCARLRRMANNSRYTIAIWNGDDNEGDRVDCIAIGNLPVPLVVFATFVGFQGGYVHGGLGYAFSGATVVTIRMLPLCYIFPIIANLCVTRYELLSTLEIYATLFCDRRFSENGQTLSAGHGWFIRFVDDSGRGRSCEHCHGGLGMESLFPPCPCSNRQSPRRPLVDPTFGRLGPCR